MIKPKKGKKYLIHHIDDFLGIFKYNGHSREDIEHSMWGNNCIHICPVFEDKREYIWGYYLKWKQYNGGRTYDTRVMRTGFNRKRKCKRS